MFSQLTISLLYHWKYIVLTKRKTSCMIEKTSLKLYLLRAIFFMSIDNSFTSSQMKFSWTTN